MLKRSAIKSTLIKMNKSTSSTVVYALHPSGGLTVAYVPIAKGLENIACFYGVQAPELFNDVQHNTMAEAVERYTNDIKHFQGSGPYFLIGWSYGAALAYEVMVNLVSSGERSGYLGLLDLPPRLHSNTVESNAPWYKLAKALFSEKVSIDWLTLEGVSQQDGVELLAKKMQEQSPSGVIVYGKLLNYIRYSLSEARWFSSYQASYSSLDFDLFIAKTTADSEAMKFEKGVSRKPYEQQWAEYSSGCITAIDIEGTHMEMLKKPNVDSLIKTLSDRIANINV